jgi:hypothetical protein
MSINSLRPKDEGDIIIGCIVLVVLGLWVFGG